MNEGYKAMVEDYLDNTGVANLRGEELFRSDPNVCVWVGDRVIELEWSIRASDRLVLTRDQARRLAKTIMVALDTTTDAGNDYGQDRDEDADLQGLRQKSCGCVCHFGQGAFCACSPDECLPRGEQK